MRIIIIVLIIAAAAGSAFAQSRCLTPEFEQSRMDLYRAFGGSKGPDMIRDNITTHYVGDTVNFMAWDLTQQPPPWITVTAVCQAVTDYAYIFVAMDQWNVHMDSTDVARVAYYWERGTYIDSLHGGIYNLDTENFGNPPDALDNDDHIYILYMALGSYHGIVFDGYFSVFNEYTEEQAHQMGGHSNEVEMFYMSCFPGDPISPIRISVLAHEFEHMIHWAHDPDEATWVDEGCAEYAMLLFGVPDPLIDFPGQPDNDLTVWSNGFSDYIQTFMFFTYLADHYGGNGILAFVVDTPQNSTDGIDMALTYAGYDTVTFGDVFANWVIANYYHGAGGDMLAAPDSLFLYYSIDPPQFQAADWIESYPTGWLDRIVNRWAADYIRFNNVNQMYSELMPEFIGEVTAEWRLALFSDSLPAGFSVQRLSTPLGTWTDTISDFGLSTNVVLALTPMDRVGPTDYTYQADVVTSVDDDIAVPSEPSLGIPYPNPFNGSTYIEVSNAPGAKLGIYDIDGRLVREFAVTKSGDCGIVWDCRDGSGGDVASGVYLFRLRGLNFDKTVRAVLLK